MRQILSIILILACFAGVLLWLPQRNLDRVAKHYFHQDETVFLTLWHVDSFEGGKNSRGTWLRTRAAEFEKSHHGIYFTVSILSPDTALAKLEAGERPDLLSVGENFLPETEAPGTVYGVGAYFLFQQEEVSGALTLDALRSLLPTLNTKRGKKVVPSLVTAWEFGLTDVRKTDRSRDAYALFLADGAASLLGTQRDWFRLTSREFSFSARPIVDENGALLTDMVQCLYRFSPSPEAEAFSVYLTSPSVQNKLSAVGLLSPVSGCGGRYEGGMAEAELILQTKGFVNKISS